MPVSIFCDFQLPLSIFFDFQFPVLIFFSCVFPYSSTPSWVFPCSSTSNSLFSYSLIACFHILRLELLVPMFFKCCSHILRLPIACSHSLRLPNACSHLLRLLITCSRNIILLSIACSHILRLPAAYPTCFSSSCTGQCTHSQRLYPDWQKGIVDSRLRSRPRIVLCSELKAVLILPGKLRERAVN